jgi:hypothetical protein
LVLQKSLYPTSQQPFMMDANNAAQDQGAEGIGL